MFPVLLFGMLLTISGVGYCSAYPDASEATAALTSAGYSEVTITDQSVITMRCSESDAMVFDYSAKNPADDLTSGFVCCGVWKGCTVRH